MSKSQSEFPSLKKLCRALHSGWEMRKAAWRQNSEQQVFLNIVCSTDVRARTLQPSLAEQNTAERSLIFTSQFEMLHNFPRLTYWVSWADNWHRWRAAPAPAPDEESEERQ